MLDLKLIRTDGGTQSRVKLDEGVVAEYAEAYKAGASFPAVTVFFDGSDRWLADGFHRYFGAKAAGKKSILENVIPGTLRDAKLYSYGANGTHGQRPTNADKRKAVAEMLADAEWCQWSDRKIAEACGVSVSFVGAMRRPEVAEKQKQNRANNAEKVAEKCSPTTPQPVAPKAPKPAKVDPEHVEYIGPSEEEIAAAVASTQDDLDLLHKLMESDDKLAVAVAENTKLRAELAVVKLSRDGYMNRSNELISRITSLKKQLEKAKVAHV